MYLYSGTKYVYVKLYICKNFLIKALKNLPSTTTTTKDNKNGSEPFAYFHTCAAAEYIG